jgi:serine/threonine protein kinase
MLPFSSSPSCIPDVIGDFTIQRLISTGSFASVWLALHSLTGRRVAIKALPIPLLQDQSVHAHFSREIALMKQLDHPLICRLYDVIETPSYLYLVLEYIQSGTLLSYVNQRERLAEPAACRLFCQLISCLDYLHQKKFITHRDIKAENILVDEHGNLRMIDFGLSREFGPQNAEMRTCCGSVAYLPPEMVSGKSYTEAADIWSAGVLLYGMVAGELPFGGSTGVQETLRRIIFSEVEYPAHFSPALVDLLTRMLVKSPRNRATIEDIKQHSWITESAYGKIASELFENDEWRVSAADQGVIRKLELMGLDGAQVQERIAAGVFNVETATYAILRRAKITERLKEMFDDLSGMENGLQSPRSELFGLPVVAVPKVRQGLGAALMAPIRRTSVFQTAHRPVVCKPRSIAGSQPVFLLG